VVGSPTLGWRENVERLRFRRLINMDDVKEQDSRDKEDICIFKGK
jgi:hypothetical protein